MEYTENHLSSALKRRLSQILHLRRILVDARVDSVCQEDNDDTRRALRDLGL